MEHFFDSPQFDSPKFDSLRSSTPKPFYEPVRYESVGELTAPKQIEAKRASNAAPRLPRVDW